ncbi:MAG: peptidoglycan DD-metalloendopeptidase family protein [Methylophilaceae bacterium]
MHVSKSVWILCLLLTGCAASQQAPVIERIPAKPSSTAKKHAPAASSAVKPAGAEKDWRPEVYTVKKGDTLFAIGLEYGYDYKEIAQANNIGLPYVIRIGQQLSFKDLKAAEDKPATATKPITDGNVVITPLNTESALRTLPQPSAGIPLLSEPKAMREPYSAQALATTSAPPVKPVADATAKPADTLKPEATKPANATNPDVAKTDSPTAMADNDAIDWAWPAQGKIVAGFNEAANLKGIDIAGTQGQVVTAAGAGKVIYSGSDLRGYGKLVIIKHNKTYLSVYAHNSQILVKEGQQVSRGQKIAEMGSSDTDQVKLHFEIRRQGKSVDPAKYLSGNPG